MKCYKCENDGHFAKECKTRLMKAFAWRQLEEGTSAVYLIHGLETRIHSMDVHQSGQEKAGQETGVFNDFFDFAIFDTLEPSNDEPYHDNDDALNVLYGDFATHHTASLIEALFCGFNGTSQQNIK